MCTVQMTPPEWWHSTFTQPFLLLDNFIFTFIILFLRQLAQSILPSDFLLLASDWTLICPMLCHHLVRSLGASRGRVNAKKLQVKAAAAVTCNKLIQAVTATAIACFLYVAVDIPSLLQPLQNVDFPLRRNSSISLAHLLLLLPRQSSARQPRLGTEQQWSGLSVPAHCPRGIASVAEQLLYHLSSFLQYSRFYYGCVSLLRCLCYFAYCFFDFHLVLTFLSPSGLLSSHH